MKSYTIPVILTIVVLVAGIFAFMPVQDASTVHTTLAGNIDKQDRVYSFHFMTGTSPVDAADDANILPFKDAAWQGSANVIVADGSGICAITEVDDATTETDGTDDVGATQTGVGSSQFDAFPSSTDRVAVQVAANMDCTFIVFLDQTTE